MMWHDGGWGWGAWLATGILMLAFWGFVAWLIVTLARHSGGTGRATKAGPDGALRILERRFASGDIEEDEYRESRDLLHTR